MELSMEQHAELSKMASYFFRIEQIADRMGIEVDTLIEELRQTNQSVYTSLKKNLLAMAEKRQHALRRNDKGTGNASIINLSVIVNEDRF